jgi:GMP synthase-like glutamine amidotransferase
MKPILILQHMTSDGPGHLQTWLRERGLTHQVVDSQAGERFPPSMDGYSALAVLGGAMSANDDLPSLRQAEGLILQAMAEGKPVIGHCLGGQLMARALGAPVRASPAPEIGWQPLQVHDTAEARQWFGQAPAHTVMHWHYESFGLPQGAHWLASSPACPHQAFAIGPHLAMQFHIEIDAEKLERWLDHGDPLWAPARLRHPSVQDAATMRALLPVHLQAHQDLADRLYTRWLAAVA